MEPKCPLTDQWIKKMWYIYTTEHYSATKGGEIISFAATQMDLEVIILSEVSQKEKNKYHMISLICGIYKNDVNLYIKQKFIYIHRKHIYNYQRGEG